MAADGATRLPHPCPDRVAAVGQRPLIRQVKVPVYFDLEATFHYPPLHLWTRGIAVIVTAGLQLCLTTVDGVHKIQIIAKLDGCIRWNGTVQYSPEALRYPCISCLIPAFDDA